MRSVLIQLLCSVFLCVFRTLTVPCSEKIHICLTSVQIFEEVPSFPFTMAPAVLKNTVVEIYFANFDVKTGLVQCGLLYSLL